MPAVRTISYDSVENEPTMVVMVNKNSLGTIPRVPGNIFYEEEGYVSMEASNYTKAINKESLKWKVIPDLGRTGSGVTIFPVTSAPVSPGVNSPHLQYEFYTYDAGDVKLNVYLSPTLNFPNGEGLKFAVSIDDEKPQIIVLNKEDNHVPTWNRWVADNIIIKTSNHHLNKSGKHTVKFWMVDPAVILQKLVLDFGGLKPSYLGPPETRVGK
jgi:hypothetical protein